MGLYTSYPTACLIDLQMELSVFISYFAAFSTWFTQGVSTKPTSSSLDAAIIWIDTTEGQTKFLGSGFIYGFPDNGTSADNSIPDFFLNDIKFKASRAGGAQIPSAGWEYGGYEEYIGQFNSSLSNYRTTRKYRADFILLPHDLWGAQGGASSDTAFPGDNGN